MSFPTAARAIQLISNNLRSDSTERKNTLISRGTLTSPRWWQIFDWWRNKIHFSFFFFLFQGIWIIFTRMLFFFFFEGIELIKWNVIRAITIFRFCYICVKSRRVWNTILLDEILITAKLARNVMCIIFENNFHVISFVFPTTVFRICCENCIIDFGVEKFLEWNCYRISVNK